MKSKTIDSCKHPYVIGLTGNIATGKSTVLDYLATKNAHAIDADMLAHEAMAPGGPAHKRIVREFGSTIVRPDSTIDRQALSAIVFVDSQALSRLEAIVHPATVELVRQDIAESRADVVILEAIKLLELDCIRALCDTIWVVKSPPATQIKRLMELRGMSLADANRRVAAQSPQAEKIAEADTLIDNNGTREELFAKLDVLWARILAQVKQRNGARS